MRDALKESNSLPSSQVGDEEKFERACANPGFRLSKGPLNAGRPIRQTNARIDAADRSMLDVDNLPDSGFVAYEKPHA
jgi:hypothetical protein